MNLYADTSTLVWKDLTGDEVLFACFDKNLLKAARLEGLRVWPEGDVR